MATTTAEAAAGARPVHVLRGDEKKVIFASSLGTVFEWYDFYLYGSLAAIIARQFFSGLDPTSAYIFALLAFAAGFLVRPFGAIVFGRLGDMIGRKYTFLVTIMLMGASTSWSAFCRTMTWLRELAYGKLIRVRGLEWLIAPRLYVRTLTGKFAVFYAASPEMVVEFERLVSERRLSQYALSVLQRMETTALNYSFCSCMNLSKVASVKRNHKFCSARNLE